MHGNLSLSLATVFGFLLVLVRMGGAFVFLPLPGIKEGPQVARIVLALSVTLAMFPLWPAIDVSDLGVGRLTAWMLAEGAIGVTVGLAVAFVTEAVILAAQIAGLQAGYAYASVIDPNTQADSSVLLVLAQLVAGLLFFSLGLDREIVRIFARSLTAHPPGTFRLSPATTGQILRLGSDMFSTGLRLALPVVALLALVDIALALLGRINAQLQLLSLSFPVKMLTALLLFAWIAVLFPTVFRSHAEAMLGAVGGVVAR